MDQIHQIIKELKKRDYTHFDVFYNLTKNQVFFTIVSIVKDQALTEDLMQDVYMKFLEKIGLYQEDGNPYAYLSKIARNMAINTYHARKKEVISEKIVDMTPSEEMVDAPDEEDIFKILDLLEDDEREIVTMHVINDLKFREIADIVGRPLGTVLWIYNKAIKKLRERVGETL